MPELECHLIIAPFQFTAKILVQPALGNAIATLPAGASYFWWKCFFLSDSLGITFIKLQSSPTSLCHPTFKAPILYLIECTLSVFRGIPMQTFSDGGFNPHIAPLPSPVSALIPVPVPVFDPPVLMNTWLSLHRRFQGYSISLVTKLLFIATLAPLNLGCHSWAAASEHAAWRLGSEMVWLLVCCPTAWRLWC